VYLEKMIKNIYWDRDLLLFLKISKENCREKIFIILF